MRLAEANTDIISELLVLLTQFTLTRRRVLSQNLRHQNKPGFAPCDLSVDAFSDILNEAITHYILNNRLVLRDTDHIHFGPNNTVKLDAVPDPEANELLKRDKAAYVQYQLGKLSENALNEKVTLKLLHFKQKQAMVSDLSSREIA